jgi:hypothetical protein
MFNSEATLPQRQIFSKWQMLNVEKAAKAAFVNYILLQRNAALIEVVALQHPW